MKGIKEN